MQSVMKPSERTPKNTGLAYIKPKRIGTASPTSAVAPKEDV